MNAAIGTPDDIIDEFMNSHWVREPNFWALTIEKIEYCRDIHSRRQITGHSVATVNNKRTETDRHQIINDLLREQTVCSDEVDDIPGMDERNRIIARTDEELEKYEHFDSDQTAHGTFTHRR